jgi:Mg-chelatase subunit ChlD
MITESPSTTTPSITKDTTLLVFVVDRSGSMESIQDDMQGGIISTLKEQKGTDTVVTLAQFDGEYELVAELTPIDQLHRYRLVPRGNTALLDAIGRTITTTKHWLEEQPEALRPERVMVVVVTDGMENASREWTHLQVMDSVRARMEEGWNFTFLGANQDAIEEGQKMGFREQDSMTYRASSRGVDGAFDGVKSKMQRAYSMPAEEMNSIAFSKIERSLAMGEEE